jgi:hypothetical protein
LQFLENRAFEGVDESGVFCDFLWCGSSLGALYFMKDLAWS